MQVKSGLQRYFTMFHDSILSLLIIISVKLRLDDICHIIHYLTIIELYFSFKIIHMLL